MKSTSTGIEPRGRGASLTPSTQCLITHKSRTFYVNEQIDNPQIKDLSPRDGQPTDGIRDESRLEIPKNNTPEKNMGRKLPERLPRELLYETDEPQYLGNIPKDLQDIIWAHQVYNRLQPEVKPLFEYYLDEIAGSNYFFHQIPPLMELDRKDFSILISIVDESSFKGRDIEVIAKLRSKLAEAQSKISEV